MNAAAAERYRARFRQVLEYIEAHLDEVLSVDRLSVLAAFSKYHFQRQFTELLGIGVYQYVQLARLKRAAWQLAFRNDRSVMEIALESGYEGPEAFARAFRKRTGQSPSEFRQQPQWESWDASYQPLSTVRMTYMNPVYCADDVRIVDFPATRVAAIEHRGDPRRIGDTIRAFIAWRKQHRLPPSVSATYNIAYDDPETTPPEAYRMDICAATEIDIAENQAGIAAKQIPGGRCAVLRHIGSDDTLHAAVQYLYAQWLPDSGEDLRDFPLYFQRVRFFPDVPEHEAVTDIFLPLW